MLTIRTKTGKTYLSEKGMIRADHDKATQTFNASFEDMRNRNENEPKRRSGGQKRHWRIWKACRSDQSV